MRGRAQRGLTQPDDAHLQRPHSPDPHLELALDAVHAFELNPLPPASPRGFAPKQEQLLGHADGVVAQIVAANVRT